MLCIAFSKIYSKNCIILYLVYALLSMYVEITLKIIVDGQPTDRQIDRPTDIVTYRAAIAA